MFSDFVLEKILTDDEMRTIPIGCQATAIHTIERILEEIGVENTDLIFKKEGV